ncbi:formyltetrahydrofolate deformylase [Amnimonas aquatica]|uniref:Formyltetrahydrofolate deformylase n=1 Tax=Amnimonas aquatica TaxID=2094561 RepID=A0A2P6ASH1_9GAMM|nr:formyltetrahydrofolate deformylase [Amnimonas aquatica]PQA42630.1 formyltetrahydrofolate deformylase [Amnimonas aquatica]
MTDTTARLLINCPDAPGIVSAVSSFLYNHGANITDLDQHATAPEGGTYFMRMEFQTGNLRLSREHLEQAFQDAVATRYAMKWHISYAAERKKVGILVSKYDHAMMELLWRWSRGSLPCDIVAVVSNHEDLRADVENFGVPFHVVPVTAATKAEAEARIEELLAGVDLIVLARYMQILSPEFTARWPHRIINIHHSFLPAFVGANPYQQAYDKGVKLIGATAHYVTADLDQGPIIEQDVERVSHRDEVPTLREMGQDVERQVLARAVRWHLEDRVLVHGNKTIVFA